MTPEERFERQMEFVLKQQAHFYANMVELDERLTRQMQQLDKRATRQIQQLTNLTLRLGRVVEKFSQQTDKRFEEVDERLSRLAEAGLRTDERLNILINIVDRRLSGNSDNHS